MGRNQGTETLHLRVRRRLVAAAAGVEAEAAGYAQFSSQEPLPGIHAAWFFEDASEATTLPQVGRALLPPAGPAGASTCLHPEKALVCGGGTCPPWPTFQAYQAN